MAPKDVPKSSDGAGGVAQWLRTWTLDFNCLGPSLSSITYLCPGHVTGSFLALLFFFFHLLKWE